MRLESDAFEDQGEFPVEYTKDGRNMSPPLRWSGLPSGTRELALTFENITPQTQEPYLHWLIYKIPADRDGLPEGLKHKRDPEEPAEALHGVNALGNVGYDGPLGTVNRTFRFRFRLYALDRPLDLGPGADKAAFECAIDGHVLDQAELTVRYERAR